jgi:hypothetical protein
MLPICNTTVAYNRSGSYQCIDSRGFVLDNTSAGEFSISKFPVEAPAIINIGLKVEFIQTEENLKMRVTYNSEQFPDIVINKFFDGYVKELKNLIDGQT